MKTHDAELQQIKELLYNNPKGMKITCIARELAMNRNACAKFIEILLMTGQVEQIEHGMSKIIILSRRTSIPTMLDRSEDFILVLDSDMKISQVNDNYLKFTGLKREALLAKRPDTAGIPVIGSQPVFDKIRQAHYGTDIRTEVQEIVSGKEFFFDLRLTPTVFNNGKRGITIIIEDVTQDKKKLELATDESRKLVAGILSCIDDAVILIDLRTAAVAFANPAAMKMFGYIVGECIGRNVGHLLGIDGTIPNYPGNLSEAFREKGHYEMKSRMKRNGSGEFPVHLHIRPIYGTSGEINNIVMVIRDLTGTSFAEPEHLSNHLWNRLVPPAPNKISYGF